MAISRPITGKVPAPVSISLGVFGAIAGIVAVVVTVSGVPKCSEIQTTAKAATEHKALADTVKEVRREIKSNQREIIRMLRDK